jgi:hypothetical protein
MYNYLLDWHKHVYYIIIITYDWLIGQMIGFSLAPPSDPPIPGLNGVYGLGLYKV